VNIEPEYSVERGLRSRLGHRLLQIVAADVARAQVLRREDVGEFGMGGRSRTPGDAPDAPTGRQGSANHA
jgi:hypothetical protein